METDCWIQQEGWQAVNISAKETSHQTLFTSGFDTVSQLGDTAKGYNDWAMGWFWHSSLYKSNGWSQETSFTHSPHKYLLKIYYEPGTV